MRITFKIIGGKIVRLIKRALGPTLFPYKIILPSVSFQLLLSKELKKHKIYEGQEIKFATGVYPLYSNTCIADPELNISTVSDGLFADIHNAYKNGTDFYDDIYS